MKRLINTVRNLFKIAKLLSISDANNIRFGQVAFLGKEQKTMIFSPYGLMHNPPVDSLTLVWTQQGQESNLIGMADDPRNRTLKSLAEGEVALGNYKTDHYLYFDENGKATLVTDDLDVLVTDTTFLTTTDLDIEVSNATTIQSGSVTATVTNDCSVTANTMNLTSVANMVLTAGGNLTLAATGVLGLSGATMSMTAGGASMGMSGGTMGITSTGLQHNGTNIGDTHYHTQGADSGGDTEQNTSGPN